jgi:hypothetical protein
VVVVFALQDETGNSLSSDIEFAILYKTGIRNVLTRICGFDEKKDKQLLEEAEKMDKEIAGFSIKLKQ